MELKVCGITQLDQLLALQAMGVDYAGLIFYEGSPRFVGAHHFSPSVLKQNDIAIKRIGVFVNASEDEILQAVDDWQLEMVQLHGEESPVFCEKISNHVKTIKAFRVNEEESLAYKVAPYQNAVEYFLFDAMGKQYGGTGNKFDWKVIAEAKIDKPYFLSGGLGPDDVDSIQAFVQTNSNCFAIDVNSRFEVKPGVKNLEIVRNFTESLLKK
ncbi:MAG: phosphoribosylanthranilate isomerase [Chitinophagaceae bacterium]